MTWGRDLPACVPREGFIASPLFVVLVLDAVRSADAENIGFLVLLCQVVSLQIRLNFVPQKGQSPLHLTSQGWIVRRICSHVAPKVFFAAQVDGQDK